MSVDTEYASASAIHSDGAEMDSDLILPSGPVHYQALCDGCYVSYYFGTFECIIVDCFELVFQTC